MKRDIIKGNIVDVINRRVYPGEIAVSGGRIEQISQNDEKYENYILPGFVDAHVHIESSMVTPVEFSRMAICHGTVSAVADPHEIVNVLGKEGLRFMVDNGNKTPFKFLFGVPSCVPATPFESSGATLNAEDVRELLNIEGVGFLAEMMNFPGVVNKQEEVIKKTKIAKELGVRIDGHAPGLRGEDLISYAGEGITTDHECVSIEEAVEKIGLGMKILIREGSGAKNFEALVPLIDDYPEDIMFCTDDSHPDDLAVGHINLLVKRAISSGYDLFDVLSAASVIPVKHYELNVGLLRRDDPADFIEVDNLESLNVLTTYIDGIKVFDNNKVKISPIISTPVNKFINREVDRADLEVIAESNKIRVIRAIAGELITEADIDEIDNVGGKTISDTRTDRLKLVVVNRYKHEPPSVGFIRGFNLNNGAIVSSIAHDSHNVICVGVEDLAIEEAINWIFKHKGGIAVHDGNSISGLPLPYGGLMSELPVEEIGKVYNSLSDKVLKLGSTLNAPFITLSFMSLLVIPSLKLGDKGLFDVDSFNFTSLFVK